MPRTLLVVGLVTAFGSIGTDAFAACTVLTDALPVPVPNGATAPTIRTGVAPNGDSEWVISGTIHRCIDADMQFVEIATPPEMGVTKTAAVLLAISGVQLIPESQLIQNKSTEWKLNSVPTAKVVDPANQDRAKNKIVVSWDASFVNIVSYQLAYTLYVTQK